MSKKVNAPQLDAKPKRDNTFRRQWVLNDEGLHDWWQRSGHPMDKFVQDNRVQIDEQIDRAVELQRKARA